MCDRKPVLPVVICWGRTSVLASVEAHGALGVRGGEDGGLGWVGEGSGWAPLTETSERKSLGAEGMP